MLPGLSTWAHRDHVHQMALLCFVHQFIYIYICIYNICIYNISTTFPISCKILRNCDSTITYGQHVFGSYKYYELQKLWPDQSRSPAGSCSWPCLARTASSCFLMLSAPWRVWADFSSWPTQNANGDSNGKLMVRLMVHNATHGWFWSIPVDLQCIQSWVVTMRHNWLFFHIFSYQTPEQGSEENKILTFETCSHTTVRGVANHWFACLDISFPAARFLNANSWQNMFFLNGAFEMGLQQNQFNKSHYKNGLQHTNWDWREFSENNSSVLLLRRPHWNWHRKLSKRQILAAVWGWNWTLLQFDWKLLQNCWT